MSIPSTSSTEYNSKTSTSSASSSKAMNSSANVGSVINLSTLPVNVPSLCIPRVFENMTKKRVLDTIQELGLGEIDHIDMVPRTSEKGEKFQRVFIHFRRWSSTSDAIRARERLLTGKDIKIIYDDPWFWKVSANRCASTGATTSTAVRPAVRPATKPSIDFNDDNDKDVDAISKMKMRNERNERNERNNNVSNRASEHTQKPTGGPKPVSKYNNNNNNNNDKNRQQQQQQPNKYKYERKQDPRFNQQVEKVEQKTFVPTTPDSSPPPTNNHRKTIDVDEPSITPLVVDFGNPVITAIKKRVAVATKKPVLVPVDDSTTAAAVSTTTEI